MTFPGDDNFVLWRIQHDMYTGPKGVGLLYAEAEVRYSAAIRLLSVTTELWDAIQRHNEKYDSRKCEDKRQVLRRLLNAVEVPELPVSGPKGTKRRPFIRLFDHRDLRHAYDTIAAAFRFNNPDLWLPLFREDETVRKVNADAWEEFWEVEVNGFDFASEDSGFKILETWPLKVVATRLVDEPSSVGHLVAIEPVLNFPFLAGYVLANR